MQNDLHLAPVGALGPPFVFAKQTERGFMLDLATVVISKQLGKSFTARDRVCLRETFIHKSVKNFEGNLVSSALCILQKIVHFLYSYLFLLSANRTFVSIFLSD